MVDSDLNVLGPQQTPVVSLPCSFKKHEPFGSQLKALINQHTTLFDPIESVSRKQRTVEHLIHTGDAKPVHQNVCQLSPTLLAELKEQLRKLQTSGLIRPSTSSWSSPILFAKNANGLLCFCVDYVRALNSVTKKDRHPLPLIQECFDSLWEARFFSKIDLQQGFHQMRIADNNVPKTAFGTKYGHFKWMVMPFGLVNAPSTFQRMMTHVLREFIDDFVQVYLDDILIYSETEAEHLVHLQREERKCSFGLEEIQYVGHLVSQNHIRPMPDKLKAVDNWPRPRNLHDVQSLLGLCGYYQRYVKNFAKIASPLHELTAGNVAKRQTVLWLPLHEAAFVQLKLALVSAPVLLTPDQRKPYVIETDASDYAVGAVVLKKGIDDALHPFAYESSKLNPSQRNYPAQERMLHAWQKWHVYLDGAVETTIVYTDHSSLVYLSSQKLPLKQLVRWLDEFSEMDIDVRYKKGIDNVVPDALSRRSYLLFIETITTSLHDSDWPLIIPYLRGTGLSRILFLLHIRLRQNIVMLCLSMMLTMRHCCTLAVRVWRSVCPSLLMGFGMRCYNRLMMMLVTAVEMLR
jgi:hypothetical protein